MREQGKRWLRPTTLSHQLLSWTGTTTLELSWDNTNSRVGLGQQLSSWVGTTTLELGWDNINHPNYLHNHYYNLAQEPHLPCYYGRQEISTWFKLWCWSTNYDWHINIWKKLLTKQFRSLVSYWPEHIQSIISCWPELFWSIICYRLEQFQSINPYWLEP